ncbi:hypothetical protein [Marinobacter goseongensis]|nr:hypothetical protein [Marinobacter goseongensis]MCK7550068.1 hypothetical protein [Marinobacter goseongensis]
MPTVSGFGKPARGRRLISAPAPVIFRNAKQFRAIDKKMVQGLLLID